MDRQTVCLAKEHQRKQERFTRHRTHTVSNTERNRHTDRPRYTSSNRQHLVLRLWCGEIIVTRNLSITGLVFVGNKKLAACNAQFHPLHDFHRTKRTEDRKATFTAWWWCCVLDLVQREPCCAQSIHCSAAWHLITDRTATAEELLLPTAHTYIHTHPCNGPMSGNTRVSRYQKGKTDLDFTGARDSEWQWHQLLPYASLHLAPER